MKKLVIVLAIVFLSATIVSANTVREDCGCGLGGVAFGEKEGLLWDLLGTFFNGVCGNQTFGMSSGTLDCDTQGRFTKNERMNIFVAENMDSLAVDIATGKGESLEALAEIAEVPVEKHMILFVLLQKNFNQIYPSGKTTHSMAVEQISHIIENI